MYIQILAASTVNEAIRFIYRNYTASMDVVVQEIRYLLHTPDTVGIIISIGAPLHGKVSN